jgi:hypothetical protein
LGRVVLTSRGAASINVDVIETHSMTALPSNFGRIEVTTAIVRMLGKAVKFRHCPATVSAPSFGIERDRDPARAISLNHWSMAPGRAR